MSGTPVAEVVTSTVSGTTLEIVINRPEALNALNREVLDALFAAISSRVSPSIRAVIITGAGEKSFVAGADVAAMSKMSHDEIRSYIEFGQRVMRAVECVPVPVIAAVNGFALGGGLELALSCDLIIASERAKVGQPEVALGIIPGFGGTQRLLRRCGTGVTRRLCLLGEIIPASEALSLGVVDRVVPPAELLSSARAWADLAASKGPGAIAGAKKVIREGEDAELLAGLRGEVEEFVRLFAQNERAEGMGAFLEKRPPRFTTR